MNPILNSYEEITYEKLNKLCHKNGAHVFAKVRTADVIPVNGSGISREEFSYALKSHFDFVATDAEYRPIFVIEFDGPSHSAAVQIGRDRMKNALCERFSLPLLRINANYWRRKFRGLDLLTYFVDCWFISDAFGVAQRSGLIPWDEDFDPAMIVSDLKTGREWPYWLSAEAQIAVQQLHRKGAIEDLFVSHWVGRDANGTYHCLSWVTLRPGVVVCATTGMRSQKFPIMQCDLVSQIGTVDTYEKLVLVLQNKADAETTEKFHERLVRYQEMYDMASYCGNRDYEGAIRLSARRKPS